MRRIGRTRCAGRLTLPHARIERRHLWGGAVFGLGFGVGATCPGMAVARTATGGLYGLVVLAGLLAGLWLRGRVERGARKPIVLDPLPDDTHTPRARAALASGLRAACAYPAVTDDELTVVRAF